MYRSLLILFLFIFCNINAQVNTQFLPNSSWTKVKSKMLNGSRDLSQGPYEYLVWKFNDKKICEYLDPWITEKKKCIDFDVDKSLINRSDKLTYQIEKLTFDSLVVIQKTQGETLPDKIKKIWFVKTSVLMKDFTNKATGDSIVITSPKVVPTLTKDIVSEMIETYLQKKYIHDFIVDGEIRIFPKKESIEVVTDPKEQNKKNQISIDLFRTTLEKNYKMWNLTGFENFEKIIIPYSFKSKIDNGVGKIVFYNRVSNKEKENEGPIINIKNRLVSIENYKKGLEAISNQKFDKAIEFFIKAHEYDNTNTDSLYNAQSILLAQNNVSDACIVLKRLKDLEQTEGTKLYKEKCSEK
ncbi:hypothetical protein SAMN05421786_11085 [Chryseobacterium ureilyticum]|uniref:Tetratricopeptide repeat-containing protein n=1 Tax=Chryseobacterium ureilyticum TaxID=373668 RepID=A0A1N7QIB5_9FLAO|nr:tetratricopeptide repeat protein [Chryseobacterium ureilyticum]SIT22548.1 hypothetical protein SAMN05421786_11085 [Chryseobacterium ureilyticum]